jgi:lipopolysaccharide heptosyltransferase II
MTPAWTRARRFLAVRTDNLGDVLMTSPALRALKEHAADAQVTLLASPSGAAVAGYCDVVDDTIVYAAPWTRHPGTGLAMDPGQAAQALAEDHALIRRLAAQRFDAAVIFTVCTQSALPAALVCRLAGIPLRLAHCRENPYDLLTDWVPDRETLEAGMRHEVERQLALVAAVGLRPSEDQLVFRPAGSDRDGARAQLAAAGGRADLPCLVVHPGASASSRRYPAERFGEAADAIAAATGWQVVFTGSADEEALVARAMAAMRRPAVSLAGRLSLGALGALIADAGLLIANNTGPVHVAAAVGTPVVVLYALTNPQHTPWRVPSRVLTHDVPCRYCLRSTCPQGHHDCLLAIPAARIVDAALELVEETYRFNAAASRAMPSSDSTAPRTVLPAHAQ